MNVFREIRILLLMGVENASLYQKLSEALNDSQIWLGQLNEGGYGMLDVHFGSGAQRALQNLEMFHTVGRRALQKRKEIRINRDVKGIDFGVTDWFHLPQNRIQLLPSHQHSLYNIGLLAVRNFKKRNGDAAVFCAFTYTCDILYALMTCFSELVSCYC